MSAVTCGVQLKRSRGYRFAHPGYACCGLKSRKNPRRGGRRIAGVRRTGRLDQEDVHFAPRHGAVLDALWHDKDFAGIERDGAVAQLDVELALQHEKEIVGVVMLVPVERP